MFRRISWQAKVRLFAVLASLLAFSSIPVLAWADGLVIDDPSGGALAQVPGALQGWALIVLIASVFSVFVKDSKLPAPVAKIVNWLALNVRAASNDPTKN